MKPTNVIDELLSNINIAVVVAIDGGLITPVLQDADKVDVYSLSRKWKELVDKARAKQLQPHEYTTGTIKSKGVIMTALLAKATAPALAKHPVINSSCRDGNSFTYNSSINIAVVVAIDGGLITPVLQDADKVFDTLFRAASNRT
ncbi:dihydrolipoyllysine-residue acetyltransferase [Trifolium repens]|nr:dihydrolipoyllysine-residue acetyltransferase [Trifolium repens]